MDLLRRLLRSEAPPSGDEAQVNPTELDALEREHEIDVLRDEQGRLSELQQRQLRFQEHSWRPPAQGGERRADDEQDSRDAAG
jgi:hypothetical protein